MLYKAIATVAFALLWAAWAQRRRRALHVRLAFAGIMIDVAMVLFLEFSRDVIGLTTQKDWSLVQWTHIGSSVLAVLLYLPVVWLGISLLRNAASSGARIAHRRLAVAALVFRTVGFCCMWSL